MGQSGVRYGKRITGLPEEYKRGREKECWNPGGKIIPDQEGVRKNKGYEVYGGYEEETRYG